MTDDTDSVREGAEAGASSAGEQTTRLRAELAARREASEIVAEANRISEQAAAEAESMVAEAETLASSLVQEARQRAEATLAQARAEALDLTNQAAAEAGELRARVERLLADIGGSLGDLGSLLSGAHSTVQRVQRTAESLADAGADLVDSDRPVAAPVAAAVSEPEPEAAPEAVEVVEAEPEQDREPVPAPDEEVVVESRESLYAVTALHGADVRHTAGDGGGSDVRARGAQAADEPAKDDLEEAPADPRPLGWLFRGH
ncbi:hypothetical protein QWJ41_07285 [Nocardioides sp. SOB44]|uniref:Uncharacterized protein n=1 Tax=Nocardioides cremeus TaxID=3058044 RepID=A0ABT8TNH5_9ACTN|nr:hypothetical protein [Nocardioides cremeus]MDO3395512.1 hypothetical protein [Nocardioides cremeus]